jgi:hypothetical protein
LDLAATTNTDRLVPNALGFYEIRHAHGARWLAVNSDRRESDLRRLPPAFISRWQQMPPRAAATTPAAASEAPPRTQSMGPMLMWIAALLLLAELLLANRYLAVRREYGRVS